MGMIVYIYKDSDSKTDCTNGGLSSIHNKFTLVNVDGPFEPTPDRPAAWLVPGNIPNTAKIVIEDPEIKSQKWPMFGGNYAATSDSRYSKAIQKLTGAHSDIIPIHDRFE